MWLYFDENRKIDAEETKKYIKSQPSKLSIQTEFRAFTLTDVLLDFDATSFYPSAMCVNKLVCAGIETGYPFELDMNHDIAEKVKNQTFAEGSADLKVLYNNPSDSIIQHLPVREKVKWTLTAMMKDSYIMGKLPTVNIKEIVWSGCKVMKTYEGVICQEIFEKSLFGKIIETLLKTALRKRIWWFYPRTGEIADFWFIWWKYT